MWGEGGGESNSFRGCNFLSMHSTPESQGQRKKGASEFTIETTNNEGTKQEKKLNLQTKGKKQEKKQREKKTNMGQQ